MTNKKVWLITGAGRGMGTDIAKAALAAGHAVVATGRNPERVNSATGAHDDLLSVKLDITDPAAADTAIRAAVDRLDGSMCWSTMQATSTPGSSRKSPPRTSARKSRPLCSAQS